MSTEVRRDAAPRLGVRVLAAAAVALLANGTAPSARAADTYVHVRLDGMVDLGMAPLVARAAELARESGAQGLFVEVDTLGGRVDAALRIRDALLNAGVPTTCWVNDRAISAGALICLAADTIDMSPGSTIGAATPVTTGGDGEVTAAGEKMTSYLRKEFAATAEARQRRRDLAEAMVDRDVEIPDVIEPGKLLTLTTEEAVTLGFAERSSADLDAALEAAGLAGLQRLSVRMTWAEEIARAISHPVVAGMLMTLGFLGLLFELKSPGWGVPGTVGLAALGLFFAGHHVVQLAGWEDVLLVGLGLVLIAVEVFVIPGFGVAGIAGIFALLAGLVLAMIGRDWEAAAALGMLGSALYTLSAAIVASAAVGVVLGRLLPRTPFVRRTLILSDTLEEATPAGGDDAGLVGRIGTARTVLRPAGSVIVDGQRHDAVSEGDVVAAGTHVEVLGFRGRSLVVRARPDLADENPQGTAP